MNDIISGFLTLMTPIYVPEKQRGQGYPTLYQSEQPLNYFPYWVFPEDII